MGLFMTPPTPAEPPKHDMNQGPCTGCPYHGDCIEKNVCAVNQKERDAYHGAQARALADALTGGRLKAPEPDPNTPPPPTYEVYAVADLKPGTKAARVLYKGQRMEGVRTAAIEVTEGGAALLTVVIELPVDSFIQIKGAKYDWRSTRGKEKG